MFLFCFSCSTSWLGMYVFYVFFIYSAGSFTIFCFSNLEKCCMYDWQRKKTDNFFLFLVWDQRGRDNLIQCLVMFFSYFFLFFLSKSCCTVVFWALQLGISNLLSQEKKKARENIFSSKCVNSKVVWRVFFFSLSFWRQIQIDLFVFVYFCQFLSFFFFPTAITIMIRLFCRFFQDYFSFFLLFLVGFWVIFLVFIRVFSVTITGFASF